MNSAAVKEAARKFGADLVGIASLDSFEGVVPEKDPRFIFPQGKSLIVIGKRIPRGVLRGVETGSALNGTYPEFALPVLEDQLLAKATYDLTIWMEYQGFEAVPLFGYDADAATAVPVGSPVAPGKPAPNVFVDWQQAAYLAGLGEKGRNGLFITPEFGPLQRFAMLITDKELEPDTVAVRNVCDNCSACQEACPLNDSLCHRCTNGALQTGVGRFNTVDKIGAACGRACLASLEERGLIRNVLTTPFRTGKPWKRDLLNRNID